MADETITTQVNLAEIEPSVRELFDIGVLYGRTKTKTNPKMKSHIEMNRNGIEIFDVDAVTKSLEKAKTFVKERVAKGDSILFVATQPPAQDAMFALIKEFNFPGVISRWLGGTLTNFKVISKRIDHFKKLKSDRDQGVFQKYTKKEQLLIERDIRRLNEFFSTLETLTTIPQVIVMVDTNLHMTALHEARHLNIPVVAFINSDANPDLVEYPVFGNNKARGAISWFLESLGVSIREGKEEALRIKTEKAAEKGADISEKKSV